MIVERAVSLEARPEVKNILTRNFIADAVEKAFPAVVNISVDSGESGRSLLFRSIVITFLCA